MTRPGPWDTPFLETTALLAALNEDEETVKSIVDQMNGSERTALHAALDAVRAAIEEAT